MKTKLRNILIALLASAMLLGMLASCTQDPPLNEPTDESASEIITEETTEITTDPVEATTEVTSDLTEETSEDSGESTEITTEDTTDITEATTESDEATTESVEETIENTTETTEPTEATTEFTEETTEIEIECKHTNLSAWYYCDDGDDNTYTLREARDCVACGEKRVETRNAAVYGYFQKIEGNTSYGGSGMGTIDLSSKNVTASDEGTLKIQFFMALSNGGFDTAVYKITGEDGATSDWRTLATRGNGISGVDAGTKASMIEKGFDGDNTSLITTANAIDLTDYEGQTVTVTLAIISKAAEDLELSDKYVICASFVNVTVPDICFHENLTAWYYYDDGDANTAEALEARDCVVCGEAKVETRNVINKGWFMSVAGDATASGFSTSMKIDLAEKSVSPTESGALAIQLWLALGNGGFDNVYYKVTTEEGESEWLLLASRGSGISAADNGTQTSLTNSGYDGANMGVVRATLSLKDYSEQTVSVTFAAVPNGAAELTDKYVIFASFKNVVVPLVDTRPALEEIAFGSSIKVNGAASAITPSTKNGAKTVTGVTVDDSCQINLNGWCAVDGGVYKYVWSADGGMTWREDFVNSERIKTTTTEAIVTTGQAYSGKTFTDLAGAYTNAQFQSGGIYIDLTAYSGRTVDVIFAAVPVVNQDVKIILCTVDDVVCSTEQ